MKKPNKLQIITISILPIMWLIYFAFELFSGRLKDALSIISNLSLVFLFALIGYIIYYLGDKYSSGLNFKVMFKIFTIFMLIDQGLKIIIKFFFFDTYFEIIPDFLSFQPIINTHGSWLNARFGFDIGFPMLILTNFIALFLFIEVYRYSIHKGYKSFDTDMCLLFLLSGALCSFIDKVFYGGSLDFIGISNLFIADIKDCYINIGILFFILAIYKSGYLSNDEDTSLKDDLESLKRFCRFCRNDLSSIIKK